MKKTLKIALGVLVGVCLIGATAGMIYGFNTNVKNWIDDKIGETINDENFKNVKVSLEKVNEDETSNVGVQLDENTAPEGYLRKVKISGFPKDYTGKKSAKVTFFNENYSSTYFVKNASESKEYAGVTVEDGDVILINHDLFDTDNKIINSKPALKDFDSKKIIHPILKYEATSFIDFSLYKQCLISHTLTFKDGFAPDFISLEYLNSLSSRLKEIIQNSYILECSGYTN